MQSVRVTICGPLDCLAGERQAETSDMHACLSIPRIIWIVWTVVNGFSFSTQFMWPYPFNSHLNYGGWHSVGLCCMFITFVKFFLFIDRHLSYFVARPQAVKHRGTSQYMAIIFYAIVHQSRAQRCLFVFCLCVYWSLSMCALRVRFVFCCASKQPRAENLFEFLHANFIFDEYIYVPVMVLLAICGFVQTWWIGGVNEQLHRHLDISYKTNSLTLCAMPLAVNYHWPCHFISRFLHLSFPFSTFVRRLVDFYWIFSVI